MAGYNLSTLRWYLRKQNKVDHRILSFWFSNVNFGISIDMNYEGDMLIRSFDTEGTTLKKRRLTIEQLADLM